MTKTEREAGGDMKAQAGAGGRGMPLKFMNALNPLMLPGEVSQINVLTSHTSKNDIGSVVKS